MSYVQGGEMTIHILYNKQTGEILLDFPDRDFRCGWPLAQAIEFRDKLDSTIKKAQAALGLEA